MPKLKCSVEVIHKVEYYDLERFIKEVYGIEYEIPPYEEVGSSDHPEYINNIYKKEALDEWDQMKLDNFMEGKIEHYSLNAIMQDMVNRDIISEGEYIITVFW